MPQLMIQCLNHRSPELRRAAFRLPWHLVVYHVWYVVLPMIRRLWAHPNPSVRVVPETPPERRTGNRGLSRRRYPAKPAHERFGVVATLGVVVSHDSSSTSSSLPSTSTQLEMCSYDNTHHAYHLFFFYQTTKKIGPDTHTSRFLPPHRAELD